MSESNTEEFKPGDVVVLKSAGPAMTVVDVDKTAGYTIVECIWFPNHETLLRQTFNAVALLKAG